jgi:hypothetical protein
MMQAEKSRNKLHICTPQQAGSECKHLGAVNLVHAKCRNAQSRWSFFAFELNCRKRL